MRFKRSTILLMLLRQHFVSRPMLPLSPFRHRHRLCLYGKQKPHKKQEPFSSFYFFDNRLENAAHCYSNTHTHQHGSSFCPWLCPWVVFTTYNCLPASTLLIIVLLIIILIIIISRHILQLFPLHNFIFKLSKSIFSRVLIQQITLH